MTLTRRILLTLAVGAPAMSLMALCLFLPAGRWDLPFFWAYIALFGVLLVAGFHTADPGLMRERIRPGPGGRDYLLIHAAKVTITAHLVLAGFDVGREHWSDTVPVTLQIPAMAVAWLGFGLGVASMAVNPFFSSVIRYQEDRGHHVISGGPYRIVRHPGYAGFFAGSVASGPALGSWIASIPMLVFAALIMRRTVLEDRFLLEHLPGYPQYAQRTRWRLVPMVW